MQREVSLRNHKVRCKGRSFQEVQVQRAREEGKHDQRKAQPEVLCSLKLHDKRTERI